MNVSPSLTPTFTLTQESELTGESQFTNDYDSSDDGIVSIREDLYSNRCTEALGQCSQELLRSRSEEVAVSDNKKTVNDDLARDSSRNSNNRAQGVRWCFTLNGPTADVVFDPDIMLYLVYGYETGESGTDHFQGYVHFRKRRRITEIKALGADWAAMHLLQARGTVLQNRDYCTKEGGLIREDGVMPRSGVSNNYQDLILAITNGQSKEEIMSEHTGEYIRHARAISEYITERDRIKPADIFISPMVLTQWQVKLLDQFTRPPDPRQVTWVVDEPGGKGKTTFSKYLVKNHGALYLDTTATARVLRAYACQCIVIFDICRELGMHDQVNYSILEIMKNGIGFSTMYTPEMKLWSAPHVIIFSNFEPNRSKLSEDRWDVYHI